MKKTRPWVRRAFMAALLVGLAWLFSKIGWSNIVEHLNRVGWAGFLLLGAAGLVEAVFDAWALQRSVPPAAGELHLWKVLSFNQAGAAVNLLVPGEAGEVLKASLLSRHVSGRTASSATLLWNIAFRLSKSAAILLAAAIAFFGLPSYRGAAALVLGLGVFNLATYFVLKFIVRRGGIGKIASFLQRLAGRLKIDPRRLDRALEHAREMETLAADFSETYPLRYASVVLLQTAARLMGFVTVWTALRFLDAGYPFALCALIYAANELLTYLIALLPSKIGGTEGSSYFLFEFLKLGGSFGTILQVVLRIKQLALTGLIFLAGSATQTFSKPREAVRI